MAYQDGLTLVGQELDILIEAIENLCVVASVRFSLGKMTQESQLVELALEYTTR